MMSFQQILDTFVHMALNDFDNPQLPTLFDEVCKHAPYIRGAGGYFVRQDKVNYPIVISDATNNPSKLYWDFMVYRLNDKIYAKVTNSHDEYVEFRQWLDEQ